LNSRERIDAILHFEEPDRIGFWIALWDDTISKWQPKIPSMWKFLREEGSEIATTGRILGDEGNWASPGYDTIVIYENERFKIMRDEYGVRKKIWSSKMGVPYILEAPVKTLDDFKEKIEAFMDPDDARRVTSRRYPYRNDLKEAIRNLQKDFYVTLWLTGPFEISRHLVGGIPQLLTIMIKEPHFASYMFNSIAKYQARICESFIDAGVDGFFLGDDLGYKNGPFFSPELYRKLLAPAHEKIIHPSRKRGKPCIIHSDGNVKMLIPDFIKIGITALNPLEVKAGMDVKELKLKYGDKLAFVGGIDVRTLASDKESIRKEVIEKINIAGQGGGFVIGPDHGIPPNVPYENYKFFRKLVMKYGRYL